MEILQFCLLASDFQLCGRGRGVKKFAVTVSNRFGKPLEVDEGIVEGYDKRGNKVTRKRVEMGPSRKIFRMYLDELIKEKLLTRIMTSDKRKKFYSITPLGICHLIKSEQFFDGMKYPHPERNRVIRILETFAKPNVKPYNSVIFENQKFINYETDVLKDIAKWFGVGFRWQVPHVFSNVNIVQEDIRSEFPINYFEFFITNGFGENNKHRLAIFDLTDDEYIEVEELDKALLNSFNHDGDGVYSGLNLDAEQFHHYLANLMLCSLVYDSAIADYDEKKLFNNLLPMLKKKKPHLKRLESFMEEEGRIPEYFLRILLLFSKHISRLTKDQYELTNEFQEGLRKIQSIKN